MSERLSVLIIAEGDNEEELAAMAEEAAAMIRRKRKKGRTFTESGEFRFNIQNASDIKKRKRNKKRGSDNDPRSDRILERFDP